MDELEDDWSNDGNLSEFEHEMYKWSCWNHIEEKTAGDFLPKRGCELDIKFIEHCT